MIIHDNKNKLCSHLIHYYKVVHVNSEETIQSKPISDAHNTSTIFDNK